MASHLSRWIGAWSNIGAPHWAVVGTCALSTLSLQRNFCIHLCDLFSLLQKQINFDVIEGKCLCRTSEEPEMQSYCLHFCPLLGLFFIVIVPCCSPPDVSSKRPPPHWPARTGPWAQRWQSKLERPRGGMTDNGVLLEDTPLMCPEEAQWKIQTNN